MSDPTHDDAAGLLITARSLTASVGDLTEQMKRADRRTYALAVSLALDVFLTLALGAFGVNFRDESDCQAQQNAAFREAVTRVRAADEEFNERELASYDAQLTLLNTGLDPTRTQAQKTAATNTYKQAILNARAAIVTKEHTSAISNLPAGNC